MSEPQPDPGIGEILTIWDSPVDMRNLLSTPPAPMPWFAVDRIQLGRGALITGVGGSSKTRLLYHLAIGGVTGTLPWEWEIAATGKAMLVLTEDTHEDVHRTLYATCKGMNLSQHEIRRVEQSVITYALAGEDVKLLAKAQTGAMDKTPHFHELESRIKSEGNVVFVGLDPALSLTTGDETDQGHQRALGKMVDDLAVRTNATAALVSHATKASLQSDEVGSHNSRGGGAITDAVRAEYAMRTMTAFEAKRAGITDLEERKRHVQLVTTKGNHLPPSAFVPVWLRRGDFGVLTAADVTFEDAHQPNERDMAALGVLTDMARAHIPTLDEWRTECQARGVLTSKTPDALKQAMKRIVTRLLSAGHIEKGMGRGVYVPVREG